MFSTDFENVAYTNATVHVQGTPRQQNRDENSAKNINTIGLCAIQNIPKPQAFRRGT